MKYITLCPSTSSLDRCRQSRRAGFSPPLSVRADGTRKKSGRSYGYLRAAYPMCLHSHFHSPHTNLRSFGEPPSGRIRALCGSPLYRLDRALDICSGRLITAVSVELCGARTGQRATRTPPRIHFLIIALFADTFGSVGHFASFPTPLYRSYNSKGKATW